MSPKANVRGSRRFVPHADGSKSSLAGLWEDEKGSELEGLLADMAGSKCAWSGTKGGEPIRTLVMASRGGST